MDTQPIEAVRRRNPYAESLALERQQQDDHGARFVYTTRPSDLNGVDAIHGGILAGLMDLTLAMAAGAHSDSAKRQFSITLSMTLNFIAAAPPGRLICIGKRIGGGHRTAFCEGRIEDESGRLVVTGSGTFKLLPPGR